MLQKIRQQFDFCLLDAPAGLGLGFRLAVCGADRCVVVTTGGIFLRDAQHTVMELRQFRLRPAASGGEPGAEEAAA